MTDPIPTLIADLRTTQSILAEAKDVSAQISYEDVSRKLLLLSCASFLEVTMTQLVMDICHELSGSNLIITSLVKTKAVDRQYHAWFDWKTPSAGPFFGMFGDDVKARYKLMFQKGTPEGEILDGFLKLGSNRNRLIHGNVASFVLDDTFEEIAQLYKKAIWFPGIARKIICSC